MENKITLDEIFEILNFLNEKCDGQFDNMTLDDRDVCKIMVGELHRQLLEQQKEISKYFVDNAEMFKFWDSYDNVPVRIKILSEIAKGIKLKDGYELRLH